MLENAEQQSGLEYSGVSSFPLHVMLYVHVLQKYKCMYLFLKHQVQEDFLSLYFVHNLDLISAMPAVFLVLIIVFVLLPHAFSLLQVCVKECPDENAIGLTGPSNQDEKLYCRDGRTLAAHKADTLSLVKAIANSTCAPYYLTSEVSTYS